MPATPKARPRRIRPDPPVLRPPGVRPARPERGFLFADEEARVVLVHVELAIEAQVLRVRAEKALDVGRSGELLELLLLERAQVLATDLRRLLELRELEPLAQARFTQAVADLEHAQRL